MSEGSAILVGVTSRFVFRDRVDPFSGDESMTYCGFGGFGFGVLGRGSIAAKAKFPDATDLYNLLCGLWFLVCRLPAS